MSKSIEAIREALAAGNFRGINQRCCDKVQWSGHPEEPPECCGCPIDAEADIAELLAELDRLIADRDSWMQQSADRVEDALRFAAERDAALSRASEVEAQTIERCAKECDEMARQFLPANFDHSDDAEECRRIRQMALSLAAAIRSMRPTKDGGVQS